jgi:hypothetical protein
MGVVVSKRVVRSLLLIISSPAEGVPVGPVLQAHLRCTDSLASLRLRMTGRKWPVTRPKGGASVLRTGGRPRQSFLLLRALRAADFRLAGVLHRPDSSHTTCSW